MGIKNNVKESNQINNDTHSGKDTHLCLLHLALHMCIEGAKTCYIPCWGTPWYIKDSRSIKSATTSPVLSP